MQRIVSFLVVLLSMPVSAQEVTSEATVKEEKYPVEVRLAPISALLGWYGIEAAYRLTNHMDIGVNGMIYDNDVEIGNGSMFFPTWEGSSYGANFNYYVKPVSQVRDTWYGSLKVNYDDYKSTGHASNTMTEQYGISTTLLAGYRGSLLKNSNRLTMMMGAGISGTFYNQTKTRKTLGVVTTEGKQKSNEAEPYFEFKVAYQF